MSYSVMFFSDVTQSSLPDSNALSAFHTKTSSVYLEGGGSASVDINFLPFHTGKRQCSVILVCESVGEIIYSIEAVATPPLPAQLPFTKQPGPNSVRISSAAAQGRTHARTHTHSVAPCDV